MWPRLALLCESQAAQKSCALGEPWSRGLCLCERPSTLGVKGLRLHGQFTLSLVLSTSGFLCGFPTPGELLGSCT